MKSAPRLLAACAVGFSLFAAPAAAAPADGVFSYAFGASASSICTAQTTCDKGSRAGASGALAQPTAVAVGGDGRVYVSELSNNRLTTLTSALAFERATGSAVGPANELTCTTVCRQGLTFGPGAVSLPLSVAVFGTKLYAPNYGFGEIVEYTTSGAFTQTFGSGHVGLVSGIAVSDSGEVWTVGRAASGISPPPQLTWYDSAGANPVDVALVAGSGQGEFGTPAGIAVHGGEVYITDSGNDRVTVIEPDGDFVREFGSPGTGAGQLTDPLGIAVDDDFAYVTDSGSNRVAVYTTAGVFVRAFGRGVGGPGVDVCTASCGAGSTGLAAGTVSGAGGIAIASDGKLLVASGSQNRVDEFETDGTYVRSAGLDVNGQPFVCDVACSAGDPGGSPGQLNAPTGIALNDSGQLWVNNGGEARTDLFTPDGTFVRGVERGGASCTTACSGSTQVEPNAGVGSIGDDALVGEKSSDRIRRIQPGGVIAATLGAPNAVNVEGVDAASDGRLFGTNTQADRVSVYSAAGALQTQFGFSGPGTLVDPTEVYIDSADRVYVGDTGNDRIVEFTTGGDYVRDFGVGQLESPHGIARVGDRIFVADTGNDRVAEFTSTGVFVRAFGSAGSGAGELQDPYDVAADANAEVFVSDTGNNRISVFDAGAPDVTLTTPADGLATAVPRPEFKGAASSAPGDATTVAVKIYTGAATTGTPLRTLTAPVSSDAYAAVPDSDLPEGSYTAVAEQTDTSGHLSRSAGRSFTIDTTTPPAPTLTIDPASPSDNRTPKLSGNAEAGSTVSVYPSGDCSGTPATATAAELAAGVAQSVPADSTTTWSAKATDGAGNTSPCSAALSYTHVTPRTDPPAAAGPPPATGTPPAATPLVVASGKITRAGKPSAKKRRGVVTLKPGLVAACPGTGPACTGKLTVVDAKTRRKLGTAKITITAGRSGALTIKLSKRQSKKLIKARRAKLRFEVTLDRGAAASASATRTVSLRF